MKKLPFYALLLSSITSLAQWNANTIINAPVAIAAKGQDNSHTVTDTKGGAIISWDDTRTYSVTGSDVYAQRIKKQVMKNG